MSCGKVGVHGEGERGRDRDEVALLFSFLEVTFKTMRKKLGLCSLLIKDRF